MELTLTVVRGSEDEGPIVYGFVRDISERRRGEEQLAYLAYHDPLTGLPNRIMVEQQLDLALARARRTRGSVVMMFVDLDDFKEVNDRLGHAAGDRLLAAVATRLRGVLRDSDLLARQGGDEFLVLLTDLTDDPGPAAESVAGKLLDALREPFVLAGAELRDRGQHRHQRLPARRRRHRVAAAPRRRGHVPGQGGRRRAHGLPPGLAGGSVAPDQHRHPAAPGDGPLRARAPLPADLAARLCRRASAASRR